MYRIRELQKKYSIVPVTQHHPLPFSKGDYKLKRYNKDGK